MLQVRFMARGFKVSGDHAGQSSNGLRWPYGPVGLITPFNFPLEIPVLQLMGALYMGNKPLLHVDHRVSLVIEQFVRLLIECGMPATDVDLLHGPGATMGHILEQAKPRSTLFTGATPVPIHTAACSVRATCAPVRCGSALHDAAACEHTSTADLRCQWPRLQLNLSRGQLQHSAAV